MACRLISPRSSSRGLVVARTPISVGFGIATPAQARAVGQLADGVIVGSALINAVTCVADPPVAASTFVSGLRVASTRVNDTEEFEPARSDLGHGRCAATARPTTRHRVTRRLILAIDNDARSAAADRRATVASAAMGSAVVPGWNAWRRRRERLLRS